VAGDSCWDRLDAIQAGLCNYLIPFFGVVLGAVVLDERLSWPMIAGGALVLGSTLLMTIWENKEKRESR
jgi:drug/metabolite transporter (DMT)-like permease